MIGVVIVPTGIGAELGGHAGDANPLLKLIGACCDKVITHPNVVNASDINEMPENCLYVEGSILDRFLCGHINLKETIRPNKILLVANAPISAQTINAVNAARVTIGIDVEVLELKTPLRMVASVRNGLATGEVTGWRELISQISGHKYDALAIHTIIEVDRDVALNYYRNGGVNPWGGVEAKASKLIANSLGRPVAHAPLEAVQPDDEELFYVYDEIIDPRIAPEALSVAYLHCILKGLHRAPTIETDLHRNINIKDVDFLISPLNCDGPPHDACRVAGIPIIVVKENKTVLDKTTPGAIVVENYWEAVGIIMSMKAGVHPSSVRRPLKTTN